MSQKTVAAQVYGKEYVLACDAGQEQHLQALVTGINARTQQLEKAVGRLPEPLMLLYTALMIADELHDTKRELATTRDGLARAQSLLDDAGAADGRLAQLEEDVAANLFAVASRMEGLAGKLSA
jgi:cell division protein ZapA